MPPAARRIDIEHARSGKCRWDVERQNFNEYSLIRTELTELKTCMTTYIGFVLGGSGAALFGLTAVDPTGGAASVFAVAPFALSVVISLVLSVLFYKFLSHNRYAGYCKLLNQEKYDDGSREAGETPAEYMLWEICMAYMRAADRKPEFMEKLIARTEIGNVTHGRLREENEESKRWKPIRDIRAAALGLWLLCRALVGNVKVGSWGFPLFITMVFLLLTGIFIAIGWLMVDRAGELGSSDTGWLTNVARVVSVIQVVAWGRFLTWLHRLLNGSRQVNAFCWKFLPMRNVLIRRLNGNNCIYEVIGLIDDVEGTHECGGGSDESEPDPGGHH